MKKVHKRKKYVITATMLCLALIIGIGSFHYVKEKKYPSPNTQTTDITPPHQVYPVVIIDAGHGGEDSGAIGRNGVLEKDLNLKIALELNTLLTSAGIETRLTRTEDILLYDKNSDYEGHKKKLDMTERLRIVQEYENAVFISIHMNSFPQERYSGLQVYYSQNSPLSIDLAQTVQELTKKNLQPDNDRKIKCSGEDIYLLHKITHPAILIECGFLSNASECQSLCSDEYRSRLCMTLYCAILNYFEGNTSISS